MTQLEIITKSSAERRLATGVVIAPNADYTVDDIENLSHEWMAKSRRFELHNKFDVSPEQVHVVESMCAPVDMRYDNGKIVKAGSWVLTLFIADQALWGRVKSGEFAAFDIAGINKLAKLAKSNQEDTIMAKSKSPETVRNEIAVLKQAIAKAEQQRDLAGVALRKASEDALWAIVNDYNATEAEAAAANMKLVELYGSRDAVALEWRRQLGMQTTFPPSEFRENVPPAFNAYNFNIHGVGSVPNGAPNSLTPAQARAAGAGMVAKSAVLEPLWESVEDPNSTTLQKNAAWAELSKYADQSVLTAILLKRAGR